MIEILYTDESASTNTLATKIDRSTPFIIAAHTQTSGRGQRGNYWESEPHKNLTFSLVVSPENITMAEQFYISKCISNAIIKSLSLYDIEAKVKWPNDIYVGDKKICGILIENNVSGSFRIIKSIIGVGINVNQEIFLSDAPNPISMKIITGKEIDLHTLLSSLAELFETELKNITDDNFDNTDGFYIENLYRFGVYAKYKDETGAFYGKIIAVEPTGELIIEKEDSSSHSYLFKEVEYIINR